MHLNIQGHGIHLTPALRDYANKKLGKLEDFFGNIIKVEVVLDAKSLENTNRSHVAEVTIWVPGKKVVHASEAGENMYASIDLVFEELKKQLIKYKEKHVEERRRVAEKAKSAQRGIFFSKDEAHKSGESLEEIKKFRVKVMTVDEAVDEQKLLKQDCFVFRNAENGEINVLHNGSVASPANMDYLSEDDAALEIKKDGKAFFPFLNMDTHEVNVLYKKKSGNFGLIEPVI